MTKTNAPRCAWCNREPRFALMDTGTDPLWPAVTVLACSRHRAEWADAFDTVERFEPFHMTKEVAA